MIPSTTSATAIDAAVPSTRTRFRVLPLRGWLYALVGATLFGLYARTLMPGAVGGDAGELQYAAPMLALVHPTGQPLYVLLGWLWTHVVPFGSVAWRMNLLAALSGATAASVTAWGVGRWTRSRWIGVISGMTLGLGATFWGQSVLADKYAFASLMTALCIGVGLAWADARQAGPSKGADRWLLGLASACGVGLLHHRSILPVVACLGLMVIWIEGRELLARPRLTLASLALVVGPALLIYPTVLPSLRANNASILNFRPNTLQEWIDFLLERHVLESEVFNFATTQQASVEERVAVFVQTLQRDHTAIVALMSVFGAAAVVVRRPKVGWPLVLIFLIDGGLAANFRGNERQFTYYLPSFVIMAFHYGNGLAIARRGVEGLTVGASARPVLHALAGAALLSPVLLQFNISYDTRRLDSLAGQPLDIWRQDLKTGNMAERLAAGLEDLPPATLLFGDWEQMTPLWYYQQVEGRRPDVTLLYPIDLVDESLGGQRPVCLARHRIVDASWRPTNVGAFVCLQKEPASTLGQPYEPLGIALHPPEGASEIELIGFRSAGTSFLAGQHTPLILAWRALGETRADYSISVRILTENWQQVWANDIGAPVLGLYPTSLWATNEIVSDYHELTIARDLAPGRYLWVVVVYRQLADGTFLELRDTHNQTQILGGTFDVLPR